MLSKVRQAAASVGLFFEDLLLLLAFLLTSIRGWFYRATLPVTRRCLSRKPNPPFVKVQDIRAHRIRFKIDSNLSSVFNVEVFEMEWAPLDAPIGEWTSVGFNELQLRTVARLKPDTRYRFRIRSKNDRGASRWCTDVEAKTRQEPICGGGHGPRYTWTQTPTEVVISFELPLGTTKRDVKVELEPDHLTLKVLVRKPAEHDGPWDEAILDGRLYGRIQSFSNGSVWEMVRETGKLMLNVILEKATKSQAPKWDYWRSIHPGHPELEIDTHLLTPEDTGISPGTGMQMVQPGTMDPAQLQAMGLGQYANT